MVGGCQLSPKTSTDKKQKNSKKDIIMSHILEACNILNAINTTRSNQIRQNEVALSSASNVFKKLISSSSPGESVYHANKLNQMLAEEIALEAMEKELNKAGRRLEDNEEVHTDTSLFDCSVVPTFLFVLPNVFVFAKIK
jgi:hypothetical protein